MTGSSISPEMRAVEINGQRIEYYEVGQGPPIVLNHGANCGADDWFNVVGPLSLHYRLIIPDRLVHEVDPWRLWLLLEHLNIDRVALLGHSGGAFTSREMYRQNPLRVWAFVCIDSAAAGGKVSAISLPNSLWPPHVATMFARNKAKLLAISPNRVSDYPSDENVAILSKTFQRKVQTPKERMVGRSQPMACKVDGPFSPGPEPIDDKGCFFQCPMLVFNSGRGKLDASDPPESTNTWWGTPIQAVKYKFVLVRDSGHWIWLDQPKEFLEQTIRFLTHHQP